MYTITAYHSLFVRSSAHFSVGPFSSGANPYKFLYVCTNWVYHVFTSEFACYFPFVFSGLYVSVVRSTPAAFCACLCRAIKRYTAAAAYLTLDCDFGSISFLDAYAYSLSLDVSYFSLAPPLLQFASGRLHCPNCFPPPISSTA